MSDSGKVYCVHCIYFIQHVHPFYPNEMMQACLSNPSLKTNYMNRKVEYAEPAEKNNMNDCSEYKERFAVKVRRLIKKIMTLGM